MGNSSSVNEEKNLGDSVVDRETEQGFTPGPWEAGEMVGYATALGVGVKGAEHALAVLTRDSNGDERTQQANARLIAAAPALYEALKEILNYGVEFDDERLSYISAQIDRDAIADARTALALVKIPDPPEAED